MTARRSGLPKPVYDDGALLTPGSVPVAGEGGRLVDGIELGSIGGAANSFPTIQVSGQSDVVAGSPTSILTLAAGANVTITTNAGTDTITIAASGGGGDSFKTIAVSGQSDVVADSATDTLTLVAGTNVTITTNAATDSITIAASGGSATEASAVKPLASAFTQLNFNGDTSLTDGSKSLILSHAVVSSSGLRAIAQSLPAAPSSTYVRWHADQAAQPGDSGAGVFVRNSTNGRVYVLGLGDINLGFVAQRWSSITAWAANVELGFFKSFLPWWKVDVSGTTVTISMSPNGEDWGVSFITETIGDYLTAAGGGSVDQVGFWIHPSDRRQSMYISHFSFTPP